MIAIAYCITYVPNSVLDIALYNGSALKKCVVQLKVLVNIMLSQICCWIKIH